MNTILKNRFLFLLVSFVLGGCASTSHNPQDPFESFNRGMYGFNDTVDKAVTKPLAKGYRAVVPAVGRTMLSNFFSNLNDVIVTINDLLQFKFAQATSDGGRVLINTTVGALGLVDMASRAGFEKHDEDFGQTLGRWGIGSGPYLVLPLLGPSSVRDGTGLYADSRASMMRKINRVDTRNQVIAAGMLSKRSDLLDKEGMLDEAAVDRYAFIRDAYLQHRQSLVYDGNPPRRKYDDEEDGGGADNHSSGNQEGTALPPFAGSEPATTPGASGNLSVPQAEPPVEDQSLAVHHVWVSQGGAH